jgi:hypothetical protein
MPSHCLLRTTQVPPRQPLVHGGFNTYGIFRKHNCMNVEVERHRRGTKFVDTLLWDQSAGQPNFDHPFSERTNIRDYVHVSTANIRCPHFHSFDSPVNLTQLLAHPFRGGFITFVNQDLKCIGVELALFPKASPFSLNFLLSFPFLT